MRSRAGPWLAAMAFAWHFQAAASDRIGPIEIIQLSQSVTHHEFGYIEHRMQLRNLSTRSAHTVDIVLPANHHGTGVNRVIRRISHTVVLSPGDTAEISLPQPSRAISGCQNALFVVRGETRGEVLVPSRQSGFSHGRILPLFVSRAVSTDPLNEALTSVLNPEAASPSTGGRRSHRGSHTIAVLTRAESEIPAWSPNWLAYSSFAAVVLSSGEWRMAPPAVREALLRYVACGGVLICMGETEVPDRWVMGQRALPGGTLRAIGIGQMLSMTADTAAGWDADTRREIVALLRGSKARWNTDFSPADAQRIFPVMDHLVVSAGGYFYLLLGFALLVGPGLLILLARVGKKIWLLWAAPVFSLAACGAVMGYALTADGITPSRRADTLVMLDQTRHEGTVIGIVGYYAPLTPGDGLRFSADTALAVFETRLYHRHQRVGRPGWNIDYTRGQHMASGFVQARVPEVMQVRKPFTARERLDIQVGPDGALSALNGLGVNIQFLRVRAPDGRWFESGPLGAGRRVDLALVQGETGSTPVMQAVASVAASNGWAPGLNALETGELALVPGTYVAELASCPFLEPGIEGRLRNRERSIVIGRYAID